MQNLHPAGSSVFARQQKEWPLSADKSGVEPSVWTFTRDDETLRISRKSTEDGTVLIVAGSSAPRSYVFRDITRLEIFQRDMETLLLKTGWSFLAFAPDRRQGRDRRGWPRRANDRRRWWTDSRSASEASETTPADADLEVTPPGSK